MLIARLLRLSASLAAILHDSGSVSYAADLAALRSEVASRRVACTDVGVRFHTRRTAAMPLEELSELHTGKACASSTTMATVADSAEGALVKADLDVVDCVTTRVDEELIGVYSVMRICDRREDAAADTTDTWDDHVLPQLQRLFSSTRKTSYELKYHGSIVEFEKPSISSSYFRMEATGRGDESEDVPRFRYKSSELWAVPDNSTGDRSLILLKLNVVNDGSVPLHIFAATVKMLEHTLSSGMLFLLPERAKAIMPSKEASVLFRVEAQQIVQLPDDAIYAVYFAHTSPRAHVLEGRLHGKKLKVNSDKKKSPLKAKNDLFSVHKIDDTSSLEAYSQFSFGMWQIASIGIVMMVGLVTTLYMRRKWTRINFTTSLDCFKRKNLKHKSSGVTKMTELTSIRSNYDPADTQADTEPSESESFKAPLPHPTQSQPNKPASRLRERMPAITMQWKKPANLREKLSIRRTLKLENTVRLNPKDFERLWEEFIQRHSGSFHATKRPSVEHFVQAMATVGVLCMASGTVNGVEKYVLYGKQADSGDYFFVSVDIIIETRETNVSIRTSTNTNDALIQQFIILVDSQLDIILK